MSEPEREHYEVRKQVAYIQVPDELLHPERYPAPKISRRTRLRWRLADYRNRVGLAWSVLRHGEPHRDCC